MHQVKIGCCKHCVYFDFLTSILWYICGLFDAQISRWLEIKKWNHVKFGPYIKISCKLVALKHSIYTQYHVWWYGYLTSFFLTSTCDTNSLYPVIHTSCKNSRTSGDYSQTSTAFFSKSRNDCNAQFLHDAFTCTLRHFICPYVEVISVQTCSDFTCA